MPSKITDDNVMWEKGWDAMAEGAESDQDQSSKRYDHPKIFGKTRLFYKNNGIQELRILKKK